MENKTKQCPHCGKEIMATAKKCRFCGTWLEEELTVTADYSTEPEFQEINSNKKIIIGGVLLTIVLLIVGVWCFNNLSTNKDADVEMSQSEVSAKQIAVIEKLEEKLKGLDRLIQEYEEGPNSQDYRDKLDEEAKKLGFEGIYEVQLNYIILKRDLTDELKREKRKWWEQN